VAARRRALLRQSPERGLLGRQTCRCRAASARQRRPDFRLHAAPGYVRVGPCAAKKQDCLREIVLADSAAVEIGRAGELALDFATAQIAREILSPGVCSQLGSVQTHESTLEADGHGVDRLWNASQNSRWGSLVRGDVRSNSRPLLIYLALGLLAISGWGSFAYITWSARHRSEH
jgi:hypothetical protein